MKYHVNDSEVGHDAHIAADSMPTGLLKLIAIAMLSEQDFWADAVELVEDISDERAPRVAGDEKVRLFQVGVGEYTLADFWRDNDGSENVAPLGAQVFQRLRSLTDYGRATLSLGAGGTTRWMRLPAKRKQLPWNW